MSRGGTKYDDALKLATESLEKLNAKNFSNRKKADEIYAYIKKEKKEFAKEIPLANFRQYLSAFLRDENSRIGKKTGYNGYYLEDNYADTSDEIPNEKVKLKVEEKLYPIVETWLKTKGFRTKNTSSQKIMGKWGNPDITGIKVDEHLGKKEIEINTIEVKISPLNFQQLFFEAVSHRRWANRSYFAFAAPVGFKKKANEELRYYSELFHVGVIVVEMEEADYENFLKGKLDEDQIADIADIYELSSVLYESKQLKWQKQFMEEALGIKKDEDVYTWGTVIEISS